MPTKKKKDDAILMYKDKPLLRCGNEIYYGNPTDKYIAHFIIEDSVDIMKMPVGTRVTIQLMTNEGERSKLIKQAERDGLYKAMDIGCYWLEDALENF